MKASVCGLAIFLSVLSDTACAGNVVTLDIQQIMASPAVRQMLDGSVTFVWGNADHVPVTKFIESYVSNQKAGFFSSGEGGCQTAFIDALTDLQNEAKAVGGNSVIELKSYYRRKEQDVGQQFPCYVSGFRSGVTIKGRIVKVGP